MSSRLNKKEMAKLERLISMMKEVAASYYSTLQTLMEGKNQWEDNNLDFFKFTINLEAGVENNQKIKSIKEILVPLNEINYQSFIKISYQDKPPKLMYFTQSNAAAVEELRSLMKSKNAVRETAFRTQKISPIAWKQVNMEKVYAQDEKNDRVYEKVHSTFSDLVTLLVSSMPTTQAFSFISAGVGNGKELTVIKKNPALSNKKIGVGGFDINSENVAIAQLAHKEGVFTEGNIQNIPSCIHEIKEKLKIFVGNDSIVILIFSGVLQRSVISGTWEALQIVQQAFADIDIVLIGSLQENLITCRMAKAMGFNVEERALRIEDSKIENSILALTKQLPEQRLAYLTKRNQKRQAVFNRLVIDLSIVFKKNKQKIYFAYNPNKARTS